tara:strand:- start:45 stop:824 length:780 start_codon:yes stop_codon:yes gene_type:complete
MIKIDTVYQKVLAIANKEQRGYLTPQDFNLFADHAQKEIFEQYFYDLNQFRRVPGNNTVYADMINNLENKISYFKRYDQNMSDETNINGDVFIEDNTGHGGEDIYKLITVRLRHKAGQPLYVAEEVQVGSEFFLYADSPLTSHTKKRPVYWKRTHTGKGISIRIYPRPQISNPYDSSVDGAVLISYIKKPQTPNWNYQIVNEKPFFKNDSESQDFELHSSDESELVYRILALAGVQIEKPQLTQTAITLETAKVQQEKQ